MQCSVTLDRNHTSGNKMKTNNGYKNSYRKNPNLDNIVEQLCSRLQSTKHGMPAGAAPHHTEAVRRYYAAFPALGNADDCPLQYYLPPPAWCRKNEPHNMQSEFKDWNKNKHFTADKEKRAAKERRNSYHGQRKNNRRRSYGRSLSGKESLPEWVTHEGEWDMDAQDPVKEFIRALAMERQLPAGALVAVPAVPDWDDGLGALGLTLHADALDDLDLDESARTPLDDEIYAKFEAKFDRSIEALWSKDQNTPDDEYQDLPIDFQDLLSSPSDHLFADPSGERSGPLSIWANDAPLAAEPGLMDGLHDRFKPLNIADPPAVAAAPVAPIAPISPIAPPREIQSFSLYDGEEIYDALSTVAQSMRSFTAINHSRDRSGFVEVPPRCRPAAAAVPLPSQPSPLSPAPDPEDLLMSARTHFRPIRREPEAAPPRYADGDTFDIRGDLDVVDFHRSESGGVYIEGSLERYLEYRALGGIDYGRLNLTAAQRCPDLDDPAFRLRFPLRQLDVAVQTDRPPADHWTCDDCGSAAKMARPAASIWSAGDGCRCGQAGVAETAATPSPPARAELAREWEELLADISAAHASYCAGSPPPPPRAPAADRKRRHSALLRCGRSRGGAPCPRPHARFLPCSALAHDRPLTR